MSAAPPPSWLAPSTHAVLRWLILPAALAAAAVLAVLLAGCQGSTDQATPPPTTAQSRTPAATAPSASPESAPESASPAADTTIAVVIADGKVSPNAEEVRVQKGQTVRVTLTSDVEESVHVHGYDKTAEASPGKPGEVTFTADVPGVFEIETHESAKLVAKLIVS